MKKTITCMLAAGFMLATIAPMTAQAAKSDEGRGGVMGFIAGCCFGIRAGADYNSGKEIHWREWCRLIPYAGVVFAVWDGIDGANGVTRADYAKQYGSTYF